MDLSNCSLNYHTWTHKQHNNTHLFKSIHSFSLFSLRFRSSALSLKLELIMNTKGAMRWTIIHKWNNCIKLKISHVTGWFCRIALVMWCATLLWPFEKVSYSVLNSIPNEHMSTQLLLITYSHMFSFPYCIFLTLVLFLILLTLDLDFCSRIIVSLFSGIPSSRS